ncbi:MAG: hypothetical protein DI623_10550 [Sphingomonas sanxanigenens]|uniref:Uncharacterized protein n=1 Tax=Sphingomonas sanxanigenens TaxID=397260 RepID=A0A2W5A4A3_9SPHN|nr:MAG: hypothetical protein DI623_10550 [Sphingomonas sanxanigenens]
MRIFTLATYAGLPFLSAPTCLKVAGCSIYERQPHGLFLPHQMIRSPHQMRFAIIDHAIRAEFHALAITGEKLPVLTVGPELAMLFKMRFCPCGHALGLCADLGCAFR